MAGTVRRAAILDAARAEFADHGFSGARTGRIAASAKSNKQLIFHYFRSKGGLYAAVVSNIFSSAPTQPDGAVATPEAVKRYVTDLAIWFADRPGAALAATECSRGSDVPESAVATVISWISRVAASLRETIDDGQRQGHFRDDVDAQAVVGFTVSAIIGRSLVRPSEESGAGTPDSFATTLGQLVADYCAWR